MEQAIAKQIKGKPIVTEIYLDGVVKCLKLEVPKSLEKLKDLEVLSLNNLGLKDISALTALQLPRLTELHLSDNKIANGQLSMLQGFTSLEKLNLSNNKIESMLELKALGTLPRLRFLDLNENPVSSKPNYREDVLKLLPGLKALDSMDRSGNPMEDDTEDDSDDDDEDDDSGDSDQGEEDLGTSFLARPELEDEDEDDEEGGFEPADEEDDEEDDDEEEEDEEEEGGGGTKETPTTGSNSNDKKRKDSTNASNSQSKKTKK
mmetsp:Transcript_3722/g.5651  ORF Transcript_3722/g.5651 Transcript_3722/m.5651 type:complete len:262 (+) Transcript_3722:71-856(+)